MVDQSFLLTSSSPPNIDGLASTAIWANCQVGDDPSDLPTSPSHSASMILLFSSLGLGGVSGTGMGDPQVLGVPWSLHVLGPGSSHLCLSWPPPSLVLLLSLPLLEFERKSAIQKPEWFHEGHMIFIWFCWCILLDTWDKYKRILDREDEEFRRAMEKEVSTLLSLKCSSKYRILAGADITHSQLDLPIFR